MSHTWTFKCDYTDIDMTPAVVTFTLPDDVSVDDMIQAFREYLMATGFSPVNVKNRLGEM